MTLGVVDPVIVWQPHNASVVVGGTVSFEVVATGTPPLQYGWGKLQTDQSQPPTRVGLAPTLTTSDAQPSDAGLYQLTISSAYGSVSASPISLIVIPVETGCEPDTSFLPNPDNDVYAVALQADGKTIVGGSFTMLAGQSCANLGRLNLDGTLDTTFNAGMDGSSVVSCLAVQPDGKIVVGGIFEQFGGEEGYNWNLGRLNPDGSKDTNFTSAANGTVCSLAVQPDGGILVGGAFSSLGMPTPMWIVMAWDVCTPMAPRTSASSTIEDTWTTPPPSSL